MEGPSLFLAAEQLKPFKGNIVLQVSGNTKIDKERFAGKKIIDIFSWGKHLVFQFDTFALRVHFLLFGSFEAIIKGKKVTGDYPRKERPIRLQLLMKNGQIDLYSCSLKFIESPEAKKNYDYTVDIMSPQWNPEKAIRLIQKHQKEQIGDVLLDQTIFAGVGNIIKNEVLFLTKIQPDALVKNIKNLDKILATAKFFSLQFYKWRKRFELKKHYQVYRKSVCPICQSKLIKKWTGKRNRVSYYCSQCQL